MSGREGNLGAIDTLLTQLQPALFNISVRMLGNREVASDACQKILLKVVTHLGGWRGEAAFSTWVFRSPATTSSRPGPGRGNIPRSRSICSRRS